MAMLLDDNITPKKKSTLDKDLNVFNELHQSFALLGGGGGLGLMFLAKFFGIGVEFFSIILNLIIFIIIAYLVYYRVLIVKIKLFKEQFHFGFFLVNLGVCIFLLGISTILSLIVGWIGFYALSNILGGLFSSFLSGMGHELFFVLYWFVCWLISRNILTKSIESYHKKNSHLSQG